jgi:uncharacterized protein YcnI
MTVGRRWQKRGRGRGVLGALVLGGIAGLLATTPAWAHVTVHPNRLPAGSSDIALTFRVPNERDNANTVSLEVFFPTNLPLLTVDVLPVPGWAVTVHTQNLSPPVHTDDGPVSQIVSDVTWKATAGGIGPGQYQDFAVAAGSVPGKAGQLVFKALQTYSSGEIVRWIEVPVAGQPAPDNPAPVLALTPGSTSASDGSASASPARPAAGSSTTAEVLAAVALAVGAVNLVGLVVLGRRSRYPKPRSA